MNVKRKWSVVSLKIKNNIWKDFIKVSHKNITDSNMLDNQESMGKN
jgi:hypothetical protein